MRLLELEDSLASKRRDQLLGEFTRVIGSQSKFWKITDMCIDHLIRQAKRVPEVYTWLHAHGSVLDVLISWLQTYPEPPSPFTSHRLNSADPRQLDIQLLKPGQSAYSYGQTPANYNTYYGKAPREKQAVLESIKAGKPLDADPVSDSDVDFSDRVLPFGQWIDCIDTSNNWLCAQVVRVEGPKVEIHFDGWSDRWNETLDMSNPRIRPLGTFTSKEQIDNRGKPRKAQ